MPCSKQEQAAYRSVNCAAGNIVRNIVCADLLAIVVNKCGICNYFRYELKNMNHGYQTYLMCKFSLGNF